MLSPVTSHHSTVGSGNTTTPSQLRSAVAGIWSTVQFSSSSSSSNLPNHGIPVASTYEKLLEKHHNTLARLKLSDPDLQETISRGFHRFQIRMRESQGQTNASVQNIGIPYLFTELHEDIRYENAQAKVLQIQAKQQETNVTSPEERKLRIARELAEARIKARQALMQSNRQKNTNPTDPTTTTTTTTMIADDDDNNDFDAASLASSSASVASDDDNHHCNNTTSPPSSAAKSSSVAASSSDDDYCSSSRHQQQQQQHSPTSVIEMNDQAGAASYVHLTLQQKHALLSVHDLDDEDDIREVATADDDDKE